jgi:serine/threonine-protein kinase
MTEPLGAKPRDDARNEGVPTPIPDGAVAPSEGSDESPTVQSHGQSMPPKLFSAQQEGIFRGGEVLDDRYRIIARIGKGGMGEVWRARHIAIQKDVAIKVLKSDEASPNHAEQAERFMREARGSAAIKHRGVADITDFGHTPAGAPYFVMELLEGRTLRRAIKQDGPLPWPAVQHMIGELAGALAAAHELGIIHCDLKPANIFVLHEEGQLVYKIIDFGIAKFTILPENARKITRTGMIHGTPKYMSPEQARGRKLDCRADVYALGCVANFALTGKPPFDGPNIGVLLSKHLKEPPVPPSAMRAGVPEEADIFVLRALEKRLEDRFQDMAEMRAAVRGEYVERPRAADTETVSMESTSMSATGVTHATAGSRSRWPRTAAFMGAMVLLGICIGGVAAWQGSEDGADAGGAEDSELLVSGGAVAPAAVEGAAEVEEPAAAGSGAPAIEAEIGTAPSPAGTEGEEGGEDADTVVEAPAPAGKVTRRKGGKRGGKPRVSEPEPKPEPEPPKPATPVASPVKGIEDPFAK